MLFTIKEKKYSEDEKIIYQGAPLDELCFLQKGVSKISCEHMHQHYLIC
jgi:signal-transduction protein with cAMP-binding, CBS, and nucleotidyltransferase domain